MSKTARNAAISRLIELNYNESTAPHIVDAVIEVFKNFTPEEVVSSILVNGRLKINTAMRTAYLDDKPVYLTPKELKVTEYFMRNTDRVIPNRTLLKDNWGVGYIEETQYIRVIIAQIREKLWDEVIKTKNGEGYYMGKFL